MKTKLAQLKEAQAEEIKQLEREERIRAALNGIPGVNPEEASIYFTGGKTAHVGIRLWRGFRTERKLSEALRVVVYFKDSIVEGEHWKAGCVSTWPAEINTTINDFGAVMDGSHAVEIEVRGGRGYGPDVEVQFWTRLAGELCEISCPVGDQWRLVPAVKGRYSQEGEFLGKIEWNSAETQTVDSFRKFWAEAPSYSGSYYLADVPNFISWASSRMSKEEFDSLQIA